jgi:hypothetical protein
MGAEDVGERARDRIDAGTVDRPDRKVARALRTCTGAPNFWGVMSSSERRETVLVVGSHDMTSARRSPVGERVRDWICKGS